MNEVVPHQSAPLSVPLSALMEQAVDAATNSMSQNTLRAYRSDWLDFETWCHVHDLTTLPADPSTLALYAAHLVVDKKRKMSTVDRRMATIRHFHIVAGYPDPTDNVQLGATLKGLRRKHTAKPYQKAPTLVPMLKKLVAACPDTLLGLRDRAILLIGFAGAFRRSELVALDVEDLTFEDQGVTIYLRHSKTDQEGEGYVKGIPYGKDDTTCPVRSLQAWLDAAQITRGPVFVSFALNDGGINTHPDGTLQRVSDQVVARTVKKYCTAIGIDPADYAGHSLRAGLATQAAKNGVPELVIAKQTGHKSLDVLRRYIRDAELYTENAAANIGL